MNCCLRRRGPTTEVRQARSVLLYAVRHGEATHNVREKEAKAEAEERCMLEAEGSPSNKVLDAAKEAARVAALQDPELHDAPLSDAGKTGALEARRALDATIASSGLLVPTLVLVSPLQRALQTAALIFPDHPDVRVREELRERRTGLPCDERSSASRMKTRRSFGRMRFSLVPQRSASRIFSRRSSSSSSSPGMSSPPTLVFGSASSDGEAAACAPSARGWRESGSGGESGDSVKTEQKADVRERSQKMLDVLLSSYSPQHDAIAIVTHKGWLREFERGPLRRPQAEEFGNLECRVFRIEVGTAADGSRHGRDERAVLSVTRAYPPEGSSETPVCKGADKV